MSSFTYTVEQIEIIRKLKRSGLTKQQLLYAFDEFEKREPNANDILVPTYRRTTAPCTLNHDLNSSGGGNGATTTQSTTSSINVSGITASMSMNISHHQMSPPSIRGMITYEETPELLAFKSKGEEIMLMEIRAFVSKYNIRQNMIAEMTRISQGYISRYFRGEGDEMSERAKNLIYMWYLQCKSNPQKLQECLGHKMILSESGDLMPIRRDRFLFSKVHIAVLERYFRHNKYPDNETKEIIAEACNLALERKTGRKLRQCDRVTAIVVNNWFNNKRKELKSKEKIIYSNSSPMLIESCPDIDSEESFDTSHVQFMNLNDGDEDEEEDENGNRTANADGIRENDENAENQTTNIRNEDSAYALNEMNIKVEVND